MSSPDTRSQAPPRPALTIFAVCLAVLIVPLGLSAPPVALPTIGQDLQADVVPLQWVVNSYNVLAASLMMAAGSIADLIGRKRVFLFGTILYGVSSLVAALAFNIYVLDVARGIGGIAAAAIMTAGAAALADMFQGPARIRAFAFIGVTIGAGLALGPSTSGMLINSLGWRSIFFAQVILVVISLPGFALVRESRNPAATKVDRPGTLTFTGSLFLFTLAIVEGPQWGWLDVKTLAIFGGAVGLLAAFIAAEQRADEPMFNLTLFKEARFLAVNLLATAVSFGFVGVMVLLPFFLIGATGVSSSAAGLTMLLLTAPILVFPLLAGRLVASGVPMRLVLAVSLVLAGIGCGWLTIIEPGVTWVNLIGPLVTIGLGIGLIYGLMDGAAVSTVAPNRVGMAVGMFNTIRLASEAVAVAVMLAATVWLVKNQINTGIDQYAGRAPSDAGSLANSVTSGNVEGPAGQAASDVRPEFTAFLTNSYTEGLRIVLWAVGAICAISAIAMYRMLGARLHGLGQEAEQPDQETADTDGAANAADTADADDTRPAGSVEERERERVDSTSRRRG
jgi:MFS family permease